MDNKIIITGVVTFAAGFGAGVAFANYRLEDKCNEIIEKEMESFRNFRKDVDELRNRRKESEETVEEVSESKDEPKPTPEEETEKPEEEIVTFSKIISKSEYGLLNYDIRTLNIYEDAEKTWSEDPWGNELSAEETEELVGIPIEDLFADADEEDTSYAYVRNDQDQTYYEIIKEV